MRKWLLGSALALALAGCANHLQTLDQQLSATLAGEPVVITQQETSSGVSGLLKQSGTITLTSSADYLYPSGGYELRPAAPVLSKMVPLFRNLQRTTITVVGYTDNTPVGPQLQRLGISNNTDLSLKRASQAVAFFQSQGVNPSLLNAQGFGDASPVASNDTPEGRAKNRRIEIVLNGDGT
jgi:outer membrane protein OmpA-like peptidoglycan-associated protein